MKKAISPVVATALLLVVAVVSVTGFHGWFSNFSSAKFSDVEMKNSNSASGVLFVDSLIGNELYVISNSNSNITILELKIGDNICHNVSDNITAGINYLNVTDCIENISLSAKEAVLLTDIGLITRKVFIYK